MTTSPAWRVTTDRDGKRCYVTAKGAIVSRDGCGSTPVTVYYPGHNWRTNPAYGMTATVAEAKEWGVLGG